MVAASRRVRELGASDMALPTYQQVWQPYRAVRSGVKRRIVYSAPMPPNDPSQRRRAPIARGPLRICERFLSPLDAQVFAARLREEGVDAQLMDADTVYANGVFPYSLALGGVRVMVPESQLEHAGHVRDAYNAGEFAID